MAVNTAGLERALRDRGRELAERIGKSFVNTAQGLAPRKTGAGADSIEVVSVDEAATGFTARIEVGEIYMRYQNEGTGIYGPDGTPIVPVSAKVLVFDSPILGLTFAPSVRGTEPTHWWDRTLDAWPRIVSDA